MIKTMMNLNKYKINFLANSEVLIDILNTRGIIRKYSAVKGIDETSIN